MSYIVNWTTTGTPPNGKPAIILPPLTIDTSSTSLTLTGHGLPNYGEIQQENFIRLLENFASASAPNNPTIGQIWYNTQDGSPYYYTKNGEWKQLGGISAVQTQPQNSNQGDLWLNTNNGTLSIFYDGQWHQIWPSLSVVPIAFVDEYNALVDVYNLVVGAPSVAPAYSYGKTTVTKTELEYDVGTYESKNEYDQNILTTVSSDSTYVATLTYGNANLSLFSSGMYEFNAPDAGPIDPTDPESNYGYGQVTLPHATIPNMTNDLWIDLLQKVKNVANFQGVSSEGLSENGFILTKDSTYGVGKCLDEFKSSLPIFGLIETSHTSAQSNALESTVLANSAATRTAMYFNAKIHEVTFSFKDINAAKVFFNAGGKFTLNIGFTETQTSTFNDSWKQFIQSIGPVIFNSGSTIYANSPDTTVGFYNLVQDATSFVELVTFTSALPASAGAYVKLQAKLVSVPNSNAVNLIFDVIYAPIGVNSVTPGAYTSSTGAAIGVTSSSFSTSKASEVYFNNPPIPYPTASQGGTFITDSTV